MYGHEGTPGELLGMNKSLLRILTGSLATSTVRPLLSPPMNLVALAWGRISMEQSLTVIRRGFTKMDLRRNKYEQTKGTEQRW